MHKSTTQSSPPSSKFKVSSFLLLQYNRDNYKRKDNRLGCHTFEIENKKRGTMKQVKLQRK